MTQSFLNGRVVVHEGDCIEVIRTLADNSIDAVVTDPPYHLTSIVKRFGGANAAPAQYGKDGAFARASRGFMGQTWDGGEIAFRTEIWTECLRVLKPGGHMVACGGTRTYHRMACAIEDAGFEIRDQLAWTYGQGFPKSHDVSKAIDGGHGKSGEGAYGKGTTTVSALNDGLNVNFAPRPTYEPATDAARQWSGWGTALKPAWEPICLARKPLSEPTVAANVLRWGTGALNIDACRVEAEPGANFKRPVNHTGLHEGWDRPWKHDPDALAHERLKRDEIERKAATIGRWPANLIHDGSEEVLGLFPETKTNGNTAGDGKYDGTSVTTYGRYAPRPAKGQSSEVGSAARFFYCAKASKHDRAGSKHPTVKPVKLMQWLVRMVTPPGGVVLDPFAGSGTAGLAARLEGFRSVLIEREAEYCADITRRMEYALAGPDARAHAILKVKGKVEDAGPLFEAAE